MQSQGTCIFGDQLVESGLVLLRDASSLNGERSHSLKPRCSKTPSFGCKTNLEASVTLHDEDYMATQCRCHNLVLSPEAPSNIKQHCAFDGGRCVMLSWHVCNETLTNRFHKRHERLNVAMLIVTRVLTKSLGTKKYAGRSSP